MKNLLFVVLLALAMLWTGGCAGTRTKKAERELALSDRSERILEQGLQAESPVVRAYAAEGLTTMGRQLIVQETLPPMLEEASDDVTRAALARELVRAGNGGAAFVLTDIVSKMESDGRVAAAWSLFELGRVGNSQYMAGLARDPDEPMLQLWAAAALVNKGGDHYLPTLRRKLVSNDSELRSTAAYVLGKVGDERSLEAIRAGGAKASRPLQKLLFTAGLLHMDDSRAADQIDSLLSSEDTMVQAQAAHLVGRFRLTKYRDRLIELLDAPDAAVRVRAADALLRIQ